MALDFRFKPQHGPARFGIEETGIGDPSLGDARHVQTGVIDKSGAVITEALGQTVQDVGRVAIAGEQYRQQREKGKALSALQEDLQGNIQSFTESQSNPQLAQESLITAAQSQTAETSLMGEWFQGTPGIEMKQIQAVRDTHANAIATLQKAQSQGRMSIQQFQDRTLAITREHINRNPALMGELLAHSKQVLGITGMSDIIEAQGKREDNEAELKKERRARLTSLANETDTIHLYKPGTDDLDEEKMMPIIQYRMEAKQLANMAKTELDLSTLDKKKQAESFAREEAPKVMDGHYMELLKNIKSTKESIELNEQQKMTAIRSHLDTSISSFRNLPAVRQLGYVTETKEAAEIYEKRVNALRNSIEKDITFEDLDKRTKAILSISQTGQAQALVDRFNVPAMKTLTDLIALNPSLFTENTKALSPLISSLGELAEGIRGSLSTNYNITLPDGKNAVTSYIGNLATNAGRGDEYSKSTLNTVIDTVYSDRQTQKFPTVESRFLFDDKFIEMIGRSGNKEGIKNLDTNAREKAISLLHQHMTLAVNNLDRELSDARQQGGTIELRTIPDGRVTLFTSGTVNEQASENIRRNYITRINNSIMAMSNLYGSSSKEAAQQLFSQYEPLKGLALQKEGETKSTQKEVTGRPNSSNPLNLTIPGKQGKFQSFDSQEEGIIAASKQIDRYVSGKTTGTPLTTVEDIAGTWNNENEKGSASKKDYVANIVRHSGLDPKATLNLNDIQTKTDLIFGMSKAEGNHLTHRQIRLALGGK